MPCDSRSRSRRASVVQQRPSETQSPQSGRSDLLSRSCCLHDAVAGTDVVQQQVGIERDRLSVKQRVTIGGCGQDGDVAGGTTNRPEQPLTGLNGVVHGTATDGREKFHEVGEVVNAAQTRSPLADILYAARGA